MKKIIKISSCVRITIAILYCVGSNLTAFTQTSRTWYVAHKGEDKFKELKTGYNLSYTGIGDFDGDGKADVFQKYDKIWKVSYGGTSEWTQINNIYSSNFFLRFGDFDGDKKTDIFYRPIGESRDWLVSYGGVGEWVKINESKAELTELAFGDFDGDGKTDVFHRPKGDSRDWLVSYGGVGKFVKINESKAKLTELAFGDFDGDGKTDVFHRPKGNSRDWLVSYGGVGKFVKINESKAELTELAFGDFDGDGKTDVFHRPKGNSRDWLVSYGGVGKFVKINESKAELTELAFGDFDGDGKTDVFYSGFPKAPDAPKDLRSRVQDSTNIVVNWKDDSNTEDGFIVSWIAKRNGYTDINGSKTLNDINRESYTLTNCYPSMEYCINVKAFNGGGKSGSTTTCVTTPASAPMPTQGFSKLVIYNCHNEGLSVHLWTLDITAGTEIWTDNGILSKGGCLPNASHKEITLINGHSYRFYAIDVDGDCIGNPNQANISCQRLKNDLIPGKSNGQAFIIKIE